MTVALTVDPGVRKAGYSVFVDGVLVLAGTAHGRGPQDTAKAILEAVAGYSIDECRIEKMRKYKGFSVAHHDLDRVEVMAKALTRALRTSKVRVKRVYPSDWKGNVPKGVCVDRARAELIEAELAAFEDTGHDAWDAVCIGLWHTKRLRRGMV